MSIFERVHELIKEQGLNVKQLERECGLANATIRRWETQTPNIESVRKVAHRLNVTIDYLVNGGSPNAPAVPSCDGVPLSSMEADFLAMFRLLPPDAREEIFDLVHFKYKRIVEQKKESIFWTYFDENDGSDDGKSGPAEGRKTRDGTA